jgi:hypothetical protein
MIEIQDQLVWYSINLAIPLEDSVPNFRHIGYNPVKATLILADIKLNINYRRYQGTHGTIKRLVIVNAEDMYKSS